MQKLVVAKRPQMTSQGDYHASIQGVVGTWGRGKTPNEALGALYRVHHAEIKVVKLHEAIKKLKGASRNPGVQFPPDDSMGYLIRTQAERFGFTIKDQSAS